jgi:HPt (histidine-containing phosphotransfer) domain-containing protein
MTLDEPSLQREVLALFDRQASLLLERMRQAAPATAAVAAHTLKGSAQGIGAWRVARAAQAVEQAQGVNLAAAIGALAAAVDEAQRAISVLLRTH